MKNNKTILLSVLAPLFYGVSAGSNVSPYLSEVLEFRPAPGQFMNVVPELTPEMSVEQVLHEVKGQLCGSRTSGLVSLGSFGGYVTVAFDHPVVNVRGALDFRIYGNAIMNDLQTRAGSAEPGSVWVSVDVNGNGLPDDPFYELKGSEYSLDTTVKNYSITYYAPEEDREPVPDPEHPFITDAQYIRWTDSEGTEGYFPKLSVHPQSYWPLWCDGEASVTFTGTRIAPVAVDASGKGINFTAYAPEWGYVDCEPNLNTEWGLDIGNAVDSEGNPVNLRQIDFIRIQTAVNQSCGWIGEASTEVSGGEDLHPDAVPEENGVASVLTDGSSVVRYFDLSGLEVRKESLRKGEFYIRVSAEGASRFMR